MLRVATLNNPGERGTPSIAGRSPLENSPLDCFQFTPLRSSSKDKEISPSAEGDEGLCPLDPRKPLKRLERNFYL
ncbi:MAG: hypothetical protein ACI4J0_01795 [Huintestinicola sp.]|uniref:hypothetical protein n=1 Tax=Huintestinicola sp. TaxID=2981661 RepID=UPI003F0CF462